MARRRWLRPPKASSASASRPSPIRAAPISPRPTWLGQTSAMVDLERRTIVAFEKLGVADDQHLHQLPDHPAADARRAPRVRRHRRGDLLQLGLRRALEFRGRAVGAFRWPHRAHAALRLPSDRTAPRHAAHPGRPYAAIAQWLGRARRRDRPARRQLLGGAGDRRHRGRAALRRSSSISARRWRVSARSRCITSSA